MKIRTDELDTMYERELLAYLRSITRRLGKVTAEEDQLLDARLAVYEEARYRRVPPITFGRLGAVAGVTEAAISMKLKQVAQREVEASAG